MILFVKYFYSRLRFKVVINNSYGLYGGHFFPNTRVYRVAQKTGPAHLIANILKTPRPNCVEIGELLQYYMLNTVINFFCLKISSRYGAT